jgi:hypothetical protein
MWAMMIDKVDSITLRTLIRNYDKSEAYVVNGNDKSIKFKTSIGVKQGGALSPRLFSIYIEDLVEKIKQTSYGGLYGTKNKKIKIDIFLYADDILLICTNKSGLQQMLKVVEQYGLDYEIVFNIGKTYTTLNTSKERSN